MADNDKMERTIQFIIEQQANLTASMGQLTEQVGKLSGTVDKLSGTVDKLSDTVDKLSGTVDQLSAKVDRTADGVAALLTIAEIHEREITTIREAQTDTDERLNALINTVERYISERRNGNASN
jgi:chromosome segregation ATPase